MRTAVAMGLLLLATLQPRGAEPLTFIRAIELPGVEGRMDHMAVDSAGHLLPHAGDRLLRGNQLAARHRLAV